MIVDNALLLATGNGLCFNAILPGDRRGPIFPAAAPASLADRSGPQFRCAAILRRKKNITNSFISMGGGVWLATPFTLGDRGRGKRAGWG